MADAGEELTEYFQAAVADSISSIQAPVDTMEQQAEHCQVEKIQGGEKWENKRKGEERGGKRCESRRRGDDEGKRQKRIRCRRGKEEKKKIKNRGGREKIMREEKGQGVGEGRRNGEKRSETKEERN